MGSIDAPTGTPLRVTDTRPLYSNALINHSVAVSSGVTETKGVVTASPAYAASGHTGERLRQLCAGSEGSDSVRTRRVDNGTQSYINRLAGP